MPVLEKVMQMKERGMPESQIIESLRTEGISPREINEAISQSNIKSAVFSGEVPQPLSPEMGNMPFPSEQSTMQPSIMTEPENQQQFFMPSSSMQQINPHYAAESSYNPPMPKQYTQQISNTADYPGEYEAPYPSYEEESQKNYPEYQNSQASDIETMNDIAEQIAEEKNTKLKKQISSFLNFKEEISIEINRMNERLTRIENVFNELQIAILKKIGDYGRNIQDIAKEMHLTQNSFSKILDPLAENMHELKKITGEGKINKKSEENKKEAEKSKHKSKNKVHSKDKKSKPKIEDFIR